MEASERAQVHVSDPAPLLSFLFVCFYVHALLCPMWKQQETKHTADPVHRAPGPNTKPIIKT